MDITLEYLEAKKAEIDENLTRMAADLNATRGAGQMLDLLINEAKQQPSPPCETPPESSPSSSSEA